MDTGPNPSAVLGLPEDATLDDARRAFRRLAKQAHPDAGGDPRLFVALARAYEALRRRPGDPRPGPPRRTGDAPAVAPPRPAVRTPNPFDAILRPPPNAWSWIERQGHGRPRSRPQDRPPVRDFAAVLEAALARHGVTAA